MKQFATRYTAAWCSHNSASVYKDRQYHYRWTLIGTNTGPGGTGRKVRISGYEEWTLGADGLIAASLGHFDAVDYARQLGKALVTP